MDAGVSGDLLLGDYLNRNGGLYTTSWYYGRAPLLINIQILYKLLLRFLHLNLMQVRLVSAVLFSIAIAASYIFMMYTAGLKRAGVLSAGIFLMPFGHWYAKYCLFGGERVLYVFVAFVSMGLVLLCYRFLKESRRIAYFAAAAAACILAFISSFGSSVMFKVFYLPLLIAVVIYVFIHMCMNREGMSEKAACALDKKIIAGLVVIPAAMFIFSCAANAIYEKYLKMWFICEEPEKNKFVYLFKEGFFDKLYDSFNFFGWIKGASIMSLNGVLNALSLVLVALVIFSFIRVGKRFRELSPECKLLWLFSLCGYFVAAMMFSSTPTYDYQDWIIISCFFAAVVAIEFKSEDISFFTEFKAAALPVVYICLILLSLSEISSLKTDAYGYSVKTDAAVDFLVSAGYEKGFAPYSEANILSELSDGEIDTYAVSGIDNLTKLDLEWNLRQRDQSVEHMSVKPEGRFFIMLPHDREYNDSGSILSMCGENKIYEDESCELYGFESMDSYGEIMESLREN